MTNKEKNVGVFEIRLGNSPSLSSSIYKIDLYYTRMYKNGKITDQDLQLIIELKNNIYDWLDSNNIKYYFASSELTLFFIMVNNYDTAVKLYNDLDDIILKTILSKR